MCISFKFYKTPTSLSIAAKFHFLNWANLRKSIKFHSAGIVTKSKISGFSIISGGIDVG